MNNEPFFALSPKNLHFCYLFFFLSLSLSLSLSLYLSCLHLFLSCLLKILTSKHMWWKTFEAVMVGGSQRVNLCTAVPSGVSTELWWLQFRTWMEYRQKENWNLSAKWLEICKKEWSRARRLPYCNSWFIVKCKNPNY